MNTTSHHNPLRIWIAASIAVISTACSQAIVPSHQIQKVAPLSADGVGYIVSNADEGDIALVLITYPEAKVRFISAQHDTYELFNVAREEIKSLLPDSTVQKNRFFKPTTINDHKDPKSVYSLLSTQLLSSETGLPDINNCKESNKTPIISVDTSATLADLSSGTLELGETLHISTAASAPHSDIAGALRSAWVVLPPEDSEQQDSILVGSDLHYKPDSYGLYIFAAIVQDQAGVCNDFAIPLVVTGNDPYLQTAPSLPSTPEWSLFTHLPLIQAEASWKLGQGEGTIIAIIDSGVNYNHEAINSNVHVNTLEISGNGIDDDNNGVVDDIVGYDFANGDNWPFDDQGHGSHVAALAASPLFGTAREAKIMSLKALSPLGGDIASIVGAIYYAVDNGASVINMSFGAYDELIDPDMQKAMDYAMSRDVLLVAAAGNGLPEFGYGLDTDTRPNYPSAMANENILAVAATTKKDRLTFYSNYGQKTVDLGAPGGAGGDELIYSAYYKNAKGILYKGMAGTSMASPIVAGVAAQVRSANPKLSALEVKQILMETGKPAPGLETTTVSGRRLDALAAMKKATSWTSKLWTAL